MWAGVGQMLQTSLRLPNAQGVQVLQNTGASNTLLVRIWKQLCAMSLHLSWFEYSHVSAMLSCMNILTTSALLTCFNETCLLCLLCRELSPKSTKNLVDFQATRRRAKRA